MTNKMQPCRILYSLTALNVSSGIFANHQEHLNCMYSFWYYSRMSLPAADVNNTRSCTCSLDAPDDEWKYRSKHVEQSRNNKLSYTVASFGHFHKLYHDAQNHECQVYKPPSSFVVKNACGVIPPLPNAQCLNRMVRALPGGQFWTLM
jgi:hypothetical protein